MRTRLLFAGVVGVLVALALVAGAASAHGGDMDRDDVDRMMDRCSEMAEGMMNGGSMMGGAGGDGDEGMMHDRGGPMNGSGTDDRHEQGRPGCH